MADHSVPAPFEGGEFIAASDLSLAEVMRTAHGTRRRVQEAGERLFLDSVPCPRERGYIYFLDEEFKLPREERVDATKLADQSAEVAHRIVLRATRGNEGR